MRKCVKKGTVVRSDGGKGISVLKQVRKDIDGIPILDASGNPVKKYDYHLQAEKFDKESESLKYVHIFISNLKSLFLGTYHGLNLQYMDLFAEEYTWRFNHRTDNNNLKKVMSLLQSAFKTNVSTANNFRDKYLITPNHAI